MAKKFNFERDVIKRDPSKKPQLILSGFGLQSLKAKAYNISPEEQEKNYIAEHKSYLGTPIFSNLEFPKGSYKNLEGVQTDFEGLVIDTVLLSVNQSKNIIKTPIQGRNGTVKEYISDGDFDVSIRGIIASESSSVYPEEEVLKLIAICKVQKELKVASRYLNQVFDVQNLVITSYSIPQTEGTQNVQMFELNCISDDPVELTIREE